MTPEVESARREWEDAYRRFTEQARDSGRGDALHEQLDVLTRELRKRVGGVFTLRELAEAYRRVDTWALEALGGDELDRQLLAALAFVEGAAFELYSRGAVDYEP